VGKKNTLRKKEKKTKGATPKSHTSLKEESLFGRMMVLYRDVMLLDFKCSVLAHVRDENSMQRCGITAVKTFLGSRKKVCHVGAYRVRRTKTQWEREEQQACGKP